MIGFRYFGIGIMPKNTETVFFFFSSFGMPIPTPFYGIYGTVRCHYPSLYMYLRFRSFSKSAWKMRNYGDARMPGDG